MSGRYICEKCLKLVPAANLVCPQCTKSSLGGALHTRCLRVDLDGLFAVWSHQGVVKKALSEIKYHHSKDVVRDLVDILYKKLPQDLKGVGRVLVPIPLHRNRENWRGFNQSVEIGRRLSELTGMDIVEDLLVRTKNTGQQVGRHKSERAQAMNGVFASKENASGMDILLVDDVWTTGATMRSAASALKLSGASRVWGVVVAH